MLRGGPLSIPGLLAYSDKHPVRIRRVVNDRALLELSDDGGPPDRLPLSLLFVPLVVRGQRPGVLFIQSCEAGTFDSTDLEFLELLAQHVPVALENANLREELGRLAHTDALTGLPHGRGFDHNVPVCLNKARQQGPEWALVTLDVHKFTRIDDSFGHQTGEEVLAKVRQVLQQTAPPRTPPSARCWCGGRKRAWKGWPPA